MHKWPILCVSSVFLIKKGSRYVSFNWILEQAFDINLHLFTLEQILSLKLFHTLNINDYNI